MASREQELAEKLLRHLDSPDRSSILEERLQVNRSAKRAQAEREQAMSDNFQQGTDLVYGIFTSNHKKAADRAVNIVGKGIAQDLQSKVRPAISFAAGIPSLDIAMGGGIPSGITEVFGTESVGKSTLLMEFMRSAQQQKLTAAICPTERFDWDRALKIGVDMENMLDIRGKDERVLSVISDFVLEDERVVFIDSLTGIRPEDGSWWCMVLAWLESLSFGTNSSVVVTNQVRARRSVDPNRFFASGTDSTAHRIAGYFSTRLELSRQSVTEHEYDLSINIVANLYSAPHKIVMLPVVKMKGIDVWKDVVRVAIQMNVLQENAGHYYYGGEHIGHGEEAMARLLESNVNFGAEIFNQTLRATSR